MSRHLTDGEMHAYLDGELDAVAGKGAEDLRRHLERCDACRTRLDAESDLRDRAGLVLADADVASGPLPPLEELRERARATTRPAATAGSRLARHRRWAWAASVVVALGVGWAVRDRAPGGVGEAPPNSGTSVDPAPEGEAARAPVAAPRDAEEAAANASAAAPPPVAPPEPSVRGAESSATAQAERPVAVEASAAAETRAATPPPPPAPTSAPTSAPAPAAPAPAPTPLASGSLAMADEAVTPPVADAAGRTANALPGREAMRVDPRDGADTRSGGDADPDADAAARTPLNEPVLRMRVAPVTPRPTPRPQAAAPGGPDLEAVEARRVREAAEAAAAAAEAGADDAGVVITVPSLEVLSVVWTEVVPGVRGVRVLQRLSPADTLELVVIPGGPDDGAAEDAMGELLEEPLRPGWSRIVRVRDAARIVARGPISAARLSGLVENVGRR